MNIRQLSTVCFTVSMIWGCGSWSPYSEETPATRSTSRQLIPTVYHIPTYDVSHLSCGDRSIVDLKDRKGRILARACARQVVDCVMQGSCLLKERVAISEAPKAPKKARHPSSNSRRSAKAAKTKTRWVEKLHGYNYVGTANGNYVFQEIDLKTCAFTFGASGWCLSPNYSVAADPKFHKPGDVIYLPDLAGARLPNGEIHDGYFIVKDTGGAIKGPDRFDFFLGHRRTVNRHHPFLLLGLGDKKSRLPFQKVYGREATLIRNRRRFTGKPPRAKIQAEKEFVESVDQI